MAGWRAAGGGRWDPQRGDPDTGRAFVTWGNQSTTHSGQSGTGFPCTAEPGKQERRTWAGRSRHTRAVCALSLRTMRGPLGARAGAESGFVRRRSRLVRCYWEGAEAAWSLPRACLESAPPSDQRRQRAGLPRHAGGHSLREVAGPGSWKLDFAASKGPQWKYPISSKPGEATAGEATAPAGE